MLIYLPSIILLGILVGLVSGMFGIGGGGIIVPALLPLLPLIHVPQSEVMFMAMGTAFATMIISTATTALNQARHHNIDFARVHLFLPSLIVAVILTSRVITSFNQNYLKLFFSLFLIYFGIKMLQESRRSESTAPTQPAYFKLKNILTAFAIGVISTLGGVSGAGLIVTFFNKTGLNIKKSIGTAAFCGVFLTLFAALGFLVTGLNYPHLPPYSLGFIHLPTVALLSSLSIPFARVGVKLMLKFTDKQLKRYFALFLIGLSLYMLLLAINALSQLYFN